MLNLASIFLPLAADLIRSYIKSSDSKKDDQILNIVQDGCRYLAPKDSNDLTPGLSKHIQKTKFWGDK